MNNTLLLRSSSTQKIFKIDNVEHLLHDTLINRLTIINGIITQAYYSNEIKCDKSSNISIYIISRTIKKYILFDREIEFKYVCAIARANVLLCINISETCAELCYNLMKKQYEIYAIRDDVIQNSINVLSFISFNNLYYNFPDWHGTSEHDYYVILYYTYALKHDFVKHIEMLVLKDNNSCYLSADKKCVFINTRKQSITGLKLLACDDRKILPGFRNKFIEGLPTINIICDNNNPNIYACITNLKYPGTLFINKKQEADKCHFITIKNEYIHNNFFATIFAGLDSNNIKIRIYSFKEHQPNIVSRMADTIFMTEVVKTDQFLYYNNDNIKKMDMNMATIIEDIPIVFYNPIIILL